MAEVIQSSNAPRPVGHYPHARRVGIHRLRRAFHSQRLVLGGSLCDQRGSHRIGHIAQGNRRKRKARCIARYIGKLLQIAHQPITQIQAAAGKPAQRDAQRDAWAWQLQTRSRMGRVCHVKLPHSRISLRQRQRQPRARLADAIRGGA